MYLSTYVNFNHHFLTKQNVSCVDSKGKISSDDRILKYQKKVCVTKYYTKSYSIFVHEVYMCVYLSLADNFLVNLRKEIKI